MIRDKAHEIVSKSPVTFLTIAALLAFSQGYILISAIFFGGKLH